MKTVSDALAEARTLGVDRLDAQLIVAARLKRPRAWVLAHGDDALGAEAPAIDAWLQRRAAGEPLAYLLGTKEFHGLTLEVSPAVLVPRPDTETLVDWAFVLPLPESARVIDLGTGSGAIALALKAARPGWQVDASDVSESALSIARANATRLDLQIDFIAGSWWHCVAPDARYDLAVSNPPYVADGDPHLAALHHEPLVALAAGADGLNDLRRIVAAAPHHLNPGGWLLLEHGWDQAEAVRALLAGTGFVEIATQRDLSGQERCSGGRLGL